MTAWWSDTVSRVMESTEVLQDLVRTRLSWFPARWVSGEGESVRSDVEKKSMSSGECSFSGGVLKSPRTTSDVPSSGQQLRRASISSEKLPRGPGGREITTMCDRKCDRDSVEFKSRSG